METKIHFHNRYTNNLELEKVYGESWLKFIYTNKAGRFLLWFLVKRLFFSKWYGWRMSQKNSANKINPFIEKYGLDVEEFADNPSEYQNFNQFFFRKLKAQSRPICNNSKSTILPADGRHLAIKEVDSCDRVFVKGQKFNLEKLFGSKELAEPFLGGSLLLSRLCPTDYHRFHFPASGKLKSIQKINGFLYSVNPIALRQNLSIFWENKRYLSIIENEYLGSVAVFLIGATCVGSVHITAKIGNYYEKGDELGYFSFGGSSLITIFQPNKINLNDSMTRMTESGYETYAKMGESIGSFI